MYEGKFERTRMKLSPAPSADIDGEVQAFRVKASGFGYVPMKLQYPPKRRRHSSGPALSLRTEREEVEELNLREGGRIALRNFMTEF